jgi:hypothetical protein
MEERETERSPFTRPGFVVSAVLLGMLVLAGLFVVIGATGHQKPTQVVAMRRGKTHAPRAKANASVSVSCSLPAGSQQVPTIGPTLEWATVGQMQAPQAPTTFGPRREQNGIGVCFAHNPTGSLLAAINFFAQATVAPPVRLIETLVADTPDKQPALTEAREGEDQLLQDSDGDPGSVQVTGYQIVDYTPAQSNLNVVLEGPGGELASVECQLDWQATDWKFVIPAGGQLTSAAVTTMDGFVSWAAGDDA